MAWQGACELRLEDERKPAVLRAGTRSFHAGEVGVNSASGEELAGSLNPVQEQGSVCGKPGRKGTLQSAEELGFSSK